MNVLVLASAHNFSLFNGNHFFFSCPLFCLNQWPTFAYACATPTQQRQFLFHVAQYDPLIPSFFVSSLFGRLNKPLVSDLLTFRLQSLHPTKPRTEVNRLTQSKRRKVSASIYHLFTKSGESINKMKGKEILRTENLNMSFERLMMLGSRSFGSGEGVKMEGEVITEWKDIPMELLIQILSLVDDQTVIMASCVCRGWRDAIFLGLTRLSLSWCNKNMNELVLSLAPKFTKLQTLILRQDKPQLEDEAVKTIASCCHDLQVLDLSKSFKLTDRSLFALAHGCRELTKLNISGCSSFGENALAYLSGFCRKLKVLNLCGCVKAASDIALKAIGRHCNQLQSVNLGWCENVSDVGVMSLAYGCPDLRTLNLCGCVCITDDSVIALANGCPHLTSLGLYYCRHITDKAMYSLAHRVKNKPSSLPMKRRNDDDDGLRTLNISQCTALTPHAVQALCDSFPSLHTCSGRHSLMMSGCLNLTSVHCTCAVQPHRTASSYPHPAH